MGSPWVAGVKIDHYTQLRWGETRAGLWEGIQGRQFLILTTYFTLRRTMKYSVVLGESLVV